MTRLEQAVKRTCADVMRVCCEDCPFSVRTDDGTVCAVGEPYMWEGGAEE